MTILTQVGIAILTVTTAISWFGWWFNRRKFISYKEKTEVSLRKAEHTIDLLQSRLGNQAKEKKQINEAHMDKVKVVNELLNKVRATINPPVGPDKKDKFLRAVEIVDQEEERRSNRPRIGDFNNQ